MWRDLFEFGSHVCFFLHVCVIWNRNSGVGILISHASEKDVLKKFEKIIQNDEINSNTIANN